MFYQKAQQQRRQLPPLPALRLQRPSGRVVFPGVMFSKVYLRFLLTDVALMTKSAVPIAQCLSVSTRSVMVCLTARMATTRTFVHLILVCPYSLQVVVVGVYNLCFCSHGSPSLLTHAQLSTISFMFNNLHCNFRIRHVCNHKPRVWVVHY